jgi:3-phenylpropionate/trans-cinnamate dioxygenase ferredoxin subunit
MADFVTIGTVNDLAPGTMKEVTVGGAPVLLAKIGDKFYATQGRCPHMGGILAKGTLEGSVVTCPRHKSQFALTDGRVIRWMKGSGLVATIGKTLKSPRGLKTYELKIENGNIQVKIE